MPSPMKLKNSEYAKPERNSTALSSNNNTSHKSNKTSSRITMKMVLKGTSTNHHSICYYYTPVV